MDAIDAEDGDVVVGATGVAVGAEVFAEAFDQRGAGEAGGAEQRLDGFVSVVSVVGVLGFDDAVGSQEQPIAGLEVEGALVFVGLGVGDEHAQGRSVGGQALHAVSGGVGQGGGVAGVGVGEGAVAVQDPEDHGDEPALGEVGGELFFESLDQLAGLVSGLGQGLEGRAAGGHEQRRAQAVAGDVGDDDGGALVVEDEGVVVVAAGGVAGLRGAGHAVARRLGQLLGEEAGLDRAGGVELVGQVVEAFAQLLKLVAGGEVDAVVEVVSRQGRDPVADRAHGPDDQPAEDEVAQQRGDADAQDGDGGVEPDQPAVAGEVGRGGLGDFEESDDAGRDVAGVEGRGGARGGGGGGAGFERLGGGRVGGGRRVVGHGAGRQDGSAVGVLGGGGHGGADHVLGHDPPGQEDRRGRGDPAAVGVVVEPRDGGASGRQGVAVVLLHRVGLTDEGLALVGHDRVVQLVVVAEVEGVEVVGLQVVGVADGAEDVAELEERRRVLVPGVADLGVGDRVELEDGGGGDGGQLVLEVGDDLVAHRRAGGQQQRQGQQQQHQFADDQELGAEAHGGPGVGEVSGPGRG